MILEGKVALVTGASRGIGRAIAIKLASEGAKVAINFAGNLTKAEEVKSEIEANNGEAILVQADVSNAKSVEDMIQQVVDTWGKIDILINNAGITRDNLMMRMKDTDFDEVINTNLKGIFNCTKVVSKLMMKQRSGRIVNMSSIVGITGNAGQTNYAAAKAGVIGFTKSAAKELAARGINVNAVAPGFIDTDMTAVIPENIKEAMLKEIPLNRIGNTEDVANAVKFLVSDESSYITGQIIRVDGGMSM
ncbi:MAG: 3-oxoacyl-[Selenomonadaceae bacterium]|nr:3-oxoacyl-[acyl-carrier-protein] reductase [Selenomonadaceae bacterium]MBR1857952.1 3-oxoacyl-[acyl-carrier-protein] reductase [Selenomonadaceae bacterium]